MQLTEDGWKVGFYTGDDKGGLEGFRHGDDDVIDCNRRYRDRASTAC